MSSSILKSSSIMHLKKIRSLAALAGLAVFCLAGQPGIASAQAADGKLVARYADQMNQLRTELKAKLPDIKNDPQFSSCWRAMRWTQNSSSLWCCRKGPRKA